MSKTDTFTAGRVSVVLSYSVEYVERIRWRLWRRVLVQSCESTPQEEPSSGRWHFDHMLSPSLSEISSLSLSLYQVYAERWDVNEGSEERAVSAGATFARHSFHYLELCLTLGPSSLLLGHPGRAAAFLIIHINIVRGVDMAIKQHAGNIQS